MIPDDEQMIKTREEWAAEHRPRRRNRKALQALESLDFRPIGYEW